MEEGDQEGNLFICYLLLFIISDQLVGQKQVEDHNKELKASTWPQNVTDLNLIEFRGRA